MIALVIGAIVSSTLLTLVVLPVLYRLAYRDKRPGRSTPVPVGYTAAQPNRRGAFEAILPSV